MRGWGERASGALFGSVSAEARVLPSHPLRLIRAVVDEALEALSAAFEALHARTGRPSVPPERLIRALRLQAFFPIRSERQSMQQLDDTLPFRGFVGLLVDARSETQTEGYRAASASASGSVERRRRSASSAGSSHQRAAPDQASRHRAGRRGLLARGHGLQPDPPAQAAGTGSHEPPECLPTRPTSRSTAPSLPLPTHSKPKGRRSQQPVSSSASGSTGRPRSGRHPREILRCQAREGPGRSCR